MDKEIINWKELLYPYEQAVDELMLKFNYIRKEYLRLGLYSPIESVEGRVKSSASIIEKVSRKGISRCDIEEKIEDIAGIRLICQFVEDIPKVIEIIRQRAGHDLDIVEERDYIANKKESGYRSYHIIIKYGLNTVFGFKEVLAEIQIRTLAMNFWAVTEHELNYKYSGNLPDDLKARLKACAEASFNLDKEMSTIREELMQAEKMTELKSSLVNNILENIQNLYFKLHIEEADNMNRRFIDLYDDGDINKLKDFNEQLNIIAEMYRV
ncbi:MAG: GTP pyrophosphokinase family protein [Clostridiales bacterium]|nr:GTP pyrophosphokinase family protein [Clostridiales bacterium]